MFIAKRSAAIVGVIGALIAVVGPASAVAAVAPRDVNTGHSVGVVAPAPVHLQDLDTEI